ncbi:MAG TPA: hypothetical protein VKS79_20510 [Gemmataceae bacterium]|nr:hypothetical protein [Gemmataceae bacterium]
MNRVRRHPWFAITAALVLLIAFLCIPARGHASCGDYVVRGNHAAAGMTDAAKQTSAAEMPCHGPNCPDHSPPAPCHGPHCSNNPDPLPFAPVTVITISMNDWAFVAYGNIDSGPDQQFRHSFPEAGHSIHSSNPVFRPPR